ncbi:MAG: hypothetical protein QXP97_00570 [Desulfurococcus sp.]|uniref:hypothetical protein n=1 Tax=Desulfurococcus sp. TaxID=51678 RepID=UPI0031670C3D
MRNTSNNNIFVEIALNLGIDIAEKLEAGEHVEGQQAWLVMDLLMQRHRTTILFEDEEIGENVECYAIAFRIGNNHVFYLLKTGKESSCWITTSSKDEVLKNIQLLEDAIRKCNG